MLLKKKMILIVFVCFFVFGYVVFSDVVDTRYTEFYFVSGGNNYETIVVNLTGGETGNVEFYLDNKSSISFPVNISFVDSMMIDYGPTDLRVCMSENETEEFGQYIGMDNSYVNVNANTGTLEQLDLNFPAWYSGLYYGCVIYTPIISEGASHLNTVPRKAIFLDVDVVPTAATFEVKVFPGTRVDQDNNKSNIGELRLYDMSYNLQYSGTIVTNDGGTGEYIQGIEDGEYFVVYKGQSHLASYISGVTLVGGSQILLDFTTGINLYGVQDKTLELNDGYKYQIAGDMKDELGQYDGDINGFDLSVILAYGYGNVGYNHPGDLDHSGKIGVSDVGIIGSNFGIRDIFHEIVGSLVW